MLTSLAFIFLVGLSLAAVCETLRLGQALYPCVRPFRRGQHGLRAEAQKPEIRHQAPVRKIRQAVAGAEVLLFVLVGAAVDVRYTLKAGPMAVAMIFLALCLRAVGVLLCLVRTPLDRKERLFCVIAYLPKATVQAAIGSVPLAMGLPCGGIVLSTAVLAILITAPLGALGMDAACGRLLNRCP